MRCKTDFNLFTGQGAKGLFNFRRVAMAGNAIGLEPLIDLAEQARFFRPATGTTGADLLSIIRVR